MKTIVSYCTQISVIPLVIKNHTTEFSWCSRRPELGASSHSLHCSPVCLLGLFVTLKKSRLQRSPHSDHGLKQSQDGEEWWGLGVASCMPGRGRASVLTGSLDHWRVPDWVWGALLCSLAWVSNPAPTPCLAQLRRGTSRAPSASLPALSLGLLRSLTQSDSKYYCTFAKEISVPPSPHNQTRNYCLFGYFAAFCSVLEYINICMNG